MADNEIIKALIGKIHLCEEIDEWGAEISLKQLNEILDLINRKQSDIEQLEIENQSLRMAANSYKLHYNEAIVKAVRDFAETLKFVWFNFSYDSPDVDFDCFVDTLVKEKVGDMNENLD